VLYLWVLCLLITLLIWGSSVFYRSKVCATYQWWICCFHWLPVRSLNCCVRTSLSFSLRLMDDFVLVSGIVVSHLASFLSFLVVGKLSCGQTHWQTNRRRWKHPPCFAMLRRWVIKSQFNQPTQVTYILASRTSYTSRTAMLWFLLVVSSVNRLSGPTTVSRPNALKLTTFSSFDGP